MGALAAALVAGCGYGPQWAQARLQRDNAAPAGGISAAIEPPGPDILAASVHSPPHLADLVPLPSLVPELPEPEKPARKVRSVDFQSIFESFPSTMAAPDEILRFEAMHVPRDLVETIVRAALITGVDPVYLMALADKESSFSTSVKAGTSSAEGLFQFIAKTWLEMVRDYGRKYGRTEEADAIKTVNGNPVVEDAAMRERILLMRREPSFAALMAGEMARRDREVLRGIIGRTPTHGEAYLAHFFGLEHAQEFVGLMAEKPKQAASKTFPYAARANKTLFYARAGKKTRSLSVTEVFGKIDGMMSKRATRYADVMNLTGPVAAFAAAN